MEFPRRAAILGSTLPVLLSFSLSRHLEAEEPQDGGVSVRLVWERTFDRQITAAGVDADCFSRADDDFSSCLKWVLTEQELRWCGGSSRDTGEVLEGLVYQSCISPSGRYLIRREFREDWWTMPNGVHYTAFDWDGNDIWQADDGGALPVVLDDGSAIFPDCVVPMDIGHRGRFWGVKWFDGRGRVVHKHDFSEKRYLWGGHHIAASHSFSAVAAADSAGGLGVFCFDGGGRLLWKRELAVHPVEGEERSISIRGYVCVGSPSGALAISAEGKVFLVLSWMRPYCVTVDVFDRAGALKDSVSLGPTGSHNTLRVFENLVLLSTARTAQDPSYLLCYDLNSMQTRFTVKGESKAHFGNFDADVDAGLVAVAVHRRSSQDSVSIYDLNGACKAQVALEDRPSSYSRPWIKLLKGSLMIGNENALQLYDLEIE